MKKFSSLETQFAYIHLGSHIQQIVEDNENLNETELQCLVSEKVEDIIKEDLQHISEGYISELVHNSFNKVDYLELIRYYRN